jgi:hypothetical protein
MDRVDPVDMRVHMTADMTAPGGSAALDRSVKATLRDLQARPWILATPGTVCHTVTVQLCRMAGFSPHGRHHADDFTTVLALVAAGLGASVVPAMALTGGAVQGVRLEALPAGERGRGVGLEALPTGGAVHDVGLEALPTDGAVEGVRLVALPTGRAVDRGPQEASPTGGAVEGMRVEAGPTGAAHRVPQEDLPSGGAVRGVGLEALPTGGVVHGVRLEASPAGERSRGLRLEAVPAGGVVHGVRLKALPTRRRTRIAYRRGAGGHPAVAAFVTAIRESCRFAPSVRGG